MKLWTHRHTWIAVFSLILLTGCAKQADLEALQVQIHYLNEELNRVESGVTAASTRVSELATDQERLRPTIQRSQMDVSFRLEEVEREIATLRNQLETSSRRHDTGQRSLQEQLESNQQRTQSSLETISGTVAANEKKNQEELTRIQQQLQSIAREISALERTLGEVKAESSATAATLAETLTESSKQPATRATATLDKQAGENNYDYIRRLFREEKYTQVRDQYPQILAGAESDNERAGIMYWYGSAVQRLGDERNAILIFEEQAKKYPRHWSTAFAILKQGHAFRALGDTGTAKLFYQRVLSEFPDSDAANYARRALE
ncbi:hypothetical protein Selin_1572 [Desulfurispirillum indicum S5]|uniref:Uncharacterized protein n=1 Tax=Desulfurispirillum indicum (strain ATCC BAA-1389 / DSM 22839 / S5) TaxID=653733 RepID=E6W7D5_DESIS|nr:tetratricopeptide repeat protein [Desulfurispirillum indicum]ADU66302.1 hypothetical protein Selin_1572 [Desulfurispirillum indicum S5]